MKAPTPARPLNSPSPSKLLARQLRSALGVDSIDALAAQYGPQASPESLQTLAQALPGLLRRVESAYLDLARDVALVQRSMELSSSELIAAREAAEAASRAKSRFLANVSHELRTPINGLSGMAQLLLEGSKLSRSDREKVEVMDRSTQALQTIISDLLDWAQVDAQRVRLSAEPFDLRALLHDVEVLLAPTAQSKGLLLQATVDRSIPQWMRGDAGRLRQIVLNLVGNALKFTEKGEVSIHFSVEADSTTSRIRLHGRVVDTGPGIAPADQARIFQPFQQGDASMTRRHGGTGLGLAISAQLARLMEGDLVLAHSDPQGSTFELRVVLDPVDDADVPAGYTTGFSGLGELGDDLMRVLVVEDNAVNQVVARAQLEHLGCAVTVVPDGHSALALPMPLAFDLVLLDLNMPDLSGLEVAQCLRAAEARLRHPAHVFICALTANAADEDRNAARAAGMDAYLAKPARLEDLDSLLKQVRKAQAKEG